MIRAVIVEDEPLARRTLRDFLGEIDWVELAGEAENGSDGVRLVGEIRPQLVFLDVQMPGLSGLELLERIPYEPAIVFTTAHDEYAVRAFEVEAIDYVMKPFDRKRFAEALRRAKNQMSEPEADAEARILRLLERMLEKKPLDHFVVKQVAA